VKAPAWDWAPGEAREHSAYWLRDLLARREPSLTALARESVAEQLAAQWSERRCRIVSVLRNDHAQTLVELARIVQCEPDEARAEWRSLTAVAVTVGDREVRVFRRGRELRAHYAKRREARGRVWLTLPDEGDTLYPMPARDPDGLDPGEALPLPEPFTLDLRAPSVVFGPQAVRTAKMDEYTARTEGEFARGRGVRERPEYVSHIVGLSLSQAEFSLRVAALTGEELPRDVGDRVRALLAHVAAERAALAPMLAAAGNAALAWKPRPVGSGAEREHERS